MTRHHNQPVDSAEAPRCSALLWARGSSSRSHVICPPLQFNTALLLRQLLVGFVRLREWWNRGRLMVLLGVFVFRYVQLAGSLVARGGGLRAPFYTRNKQVFDNTGLQTTFSFILMSCFVQLTHDISHFSATWTLHGCVETNIFRRRDLCRWRHSLTLSSIF